MDPERVRAPIEAAVGRLEGLTALDRFGPAIEGRVAALPEGPRDVLAGAPLGHPLHPALTDLPIGFWTSAFVLDLLGGRRSARIATAFVALGLASALPTAAAGAVDWTRLDPPRRRVGVVHAVANSVATVLYASSLWHRLRGRRGKGVALGLVAATAATAGGLLGGHLAYGVDPAEDDGEADVATVAGGNGHTHEHHLR